ncbi:disulfide bond formation protein B [Rossellomorea vietnamensis]|uniref:Probable disulfide formation protein n=1 Tax=Rossellomorea vietnamensis TaxID=218284 RepID=A0A5D4MDN4_9BACI|nr:disulfide oxidoreductase [Rossellomorea vietnamensis]TYR99598.1 disulfide bond formation protein B [Rossellomorea vietnamensis]
MDKKIENLLLTAFAAALISMLGSLFFSEIKQYEPCVLCWYQRIIMYPMAVILGIATVKKDASIAIYTLVLSGIGILTSLYHYSLQKVDFLYDAAPSCGRVPCTGEYINWLGFITIPFLALTAFIIIFITSFLLLKTARENKK